MSDNTFSNMMSASAAASASEAASEARKAKNAAEERLESYGYNPFITLDIRELESVPVKNKNAGFLASIFGSSKKRLSKKGSRVSVKRTDISHLGEHVDDYGTPYTKVHLESRCNLSAESVDVPGTLEENQNLINVK